MSGELAAPFVHSLPSTLAWGSHVCLRRTACKDSLSLSFQDFSVKMASIFKDFVTTYNRTYDSQEGEDLALARCVLIGSGPPLQLGTLVLE